MSNEKKMTDRYKVCRIMNTIMLVMSLYGGGEVPNKMRLLADRIEAAWNRREICNRMNREAAIGKEEDAKYEYEIQGKYEGKWLTEAKNFSSINEAKVNRPAEWEVVE